MKKKLLDKKNIYLLGLLFLVCLFLFISICTPLAGDDWCYAVNGMEGNPITKAFEFYQTWSGRFFSELWGFVITNNKWVWNVINPLLFGLVFLLIYKLSDVKKNYFLIVLSILSFILSVNKDVRMETYTWIMGTTYVIPLCLSLLYFYVFEKVYLSKTNTKWLYACNTILLIAGMMMENISASIIVGITILTIYCYFNKKELLIPLLSNLIVSVAAFTLMRTSPGSTARLLRDYPTWSEYSMIKKISLGYPVFVQTTFIDNNYMIALLSIVMSALVLFSKRSNKFMLKIINIVINGIGVLVVFSFAYLKEGNIFSNGESLFSKIFWIIYIINIFYQIAYYVENEYRRNKSIFFLMFGGSAALAMLFSPLYEARSSLYTIYYVALVASLIIEEIEFNKFINIGLCLLMLGIICFKTSDYVNKYNLVREYNKIRTKDIEYFKNHPNEETAGFLRYPIDTIHGIDIEWDDFVHMQAFGDYYDLPQAYDNIYFYYLEQ